ncbi:MAG: hypothetical protein JWM19_6210 [Actinomycetia bacterium]|nr:hypothetical protein [Actinomycetes bacterium]
MPEKVSISHRGARFEIGMGKRYYAIWAIGAPPTAPVDRWPETTDGWSQAWARFTAIETPGTIAPVPRKRPFSLSGLAGGQRGGAGKEAGPRATTKVLTGAAGTWIAAAVLAFGVLLGIAGLFPSYFTGQSLASTSDQLVPHVMDLVVWAAAAALGLLGGPRARMGGLLGSGLSAVTFGLFASDLATATAGHVGVGAGMVITLGGWLACAVGSALALVASRDGQAADGTPGAGSARGVLRRPRRSDMGAVTLLVLCAVGAAASFVPSWDSYTLAASSTGSAQTLTVGNAFDNPGWVIFCDMATVVLLIAAVAVAALWRPARQGSALLAGAIIAMAGQAVSALLQVSQPASPAQFGFSAAQAQADGLTISSGVTSIFWVYVVFVIAMAISCAWLATAPNGAAGNPLPAYPGPAYPAGGYQAGSYPAPSYPAAAGTAASSEPGDDTVTDSGEQAADDAERAADGADHQADDEDRADNEVSTP